MVSRDRASWAKVGGQGQDPGQPPGVTGARSGPATAVRPLQNLRITHEVKMWDRLFLPRGRSCRSGIWFCTVVQMFFSVCADSS